MALIIEDGTLVTGADAYENEADTQARLTGLGFTAFAGLAAAAQESTIRRQTLAAEAYIGSAILGRSSRSPAGLLFPRSGVYRSGKLIPSNEIPEELKTGIALRCEQSAAGGLPSAFQVGGIEEIRSHDQVVKFSSPSPESFETVSREAADHLDKLRDLRAVFP